MKIQIPNENGFLPEKYAKHSDVKINGNPVVSFPIKLDDIPKNAKTLAIVFVDFDSIPVCGFAWIHWTAANIPADISEIHENASQDGAFGMVQGANSCASPFVGEKDERVTKRYIGPCPPDKDHMYKLTVYALDGELDVKEGFFLNELLEKMNGHIIEKVSLNIGGRC
ncbi:MAG: YbhB/YbcL family Raf kinase inhibitor-like protein [Ruminococcaceae bacterium]|nr:YbhB/YbcL family Raf kinase inhibitor-like protein [Oscillospiraceae bacterium]